MSATVWVALAAVGAAAALGPCVLLFRNLGRFRPPGPPSSQGRDPEPISVLIPARDEEGSIAGAVRSALASRGPGGRPLDLEVVVLDDGSRDATADVVAALAEEDPRVRLETALPLPSGWCGKQHACAVLAELARHPILCFVDADVRLAPDGLARAAGFLASSGADLVSGFPRQETGTFAERLLIPLIHFVLLGFLPLGRMRTRPDPAYGAGCGQLFLARREAYLEAGGHGAIRASLHDGIMLPRAFRRAGFRTDLFDGTDVARCRMYRGAAEVWRGLGKNAGEGLGASATIVPATLVLLAGQVLPPALLVAGVAGRAMGVDVPDAALALAAGGAAAAWAPRFAAASRFRQPLRGALWHPVGVLALLAIQWQAAFRRLTGRPSGWKGRSYGVELGGAAVGGSAASGQPPARNSRTTG